MRLEFSPERKTWIEVFDKRLLRRTLVLRGGKQHEIARNRTASLMTFTCHKMFLGW
jgi:hypothetical protein